jgi:hypothetical protein
MSVGGARATVEDEMDKARTWRAAGNEGRARVCARRAAGFALAASAGVAGRPNVYEALRRAARAPALPEAVREAAARLTVCVTEAHRLPHPEDPLEDARLIIEELGPTLTSQVDGHGSGEEDAV